MQSKNIKNTYFLIKFSLDQKVLFYVNCLKKKLYASKKKVIVKLKKNFSTSKLKKGDEKNLAFFGPWTYF